MPAKKNILVAEDSNGDFFMLKKAFAQAGLPHKIQRVRDGAETLAYLMGQAPFSDPRQFPYPDLLIMDTTLPNVSALDVFHCVRKELKLQIPVVLLAPSLIVPDMRRAVELGKTDYFLKPITSRVLLDIVRKIQQNWLEGSEPPPFA